MAIKNLNIQNRRITISIQISPSASLAVQLNKVASVVEHVPYEVSKLNIRCHSVDLVKQ